MHRGLKPTATVLDRYAVGSGFIHFPSRTEFSGARSGCLRLALALAGSELRGQRGWITVDAAERMLRSGSGGLLKCHEHAAAVLQPAADAAPPFLIVVDQFEELFRFAGLHEAELKARLPEEEAARRVLPLDSPRDEAGEFVSQLLHTVSQPAPVFSPGRRSEIAAGR